MADDKSIHSESISWCRNFVDRSASLLVANDVEVHGLVAGHLHIHTITEAVHDRI